MLFSILALVTLTFLSTAHGQTCAQKGSLTARLSMILMNNDANNDGVVSGVEIYADLHGNYDADKDGCVTLKEWTDRWVQEFNFTAAYAVARLHGVRLANFSDPCTFVYADYQGNSSIRIPDAHFMNDQVQSLVDLCLDPSQAGNLVGNCDCAELQDTCTNAAIVNKTPACINYLNVVKFGMMCDGKGYLGDRMAVNAKINDDNGDGIVTGPEFYHDFSTNYDTNNDSCISRTEWSVRLQDGLKFSHAFTKQRLVDIAPDVTVPCIINYSFYKMDTKTMLPNNVFLQMNLQTMVNACQNDADLYRTDCDCAQLKDACMNDPAMKVNIVCTAYIASA